ncbi:MAG: TonB-dependent receptor [Flavobacteriaceae bacterium]|nr:TonB-dependent receptor [Flavobacteriaceae bacterium]
MEKFKKIQKFFFEKMRINVKQVQFFVLFFSLVLVNSQARGILYSQNDKMTLIVDNQPLSTIFEDIESNSDFSFFYMMDQVDVSKKVSVNLVNIPLKNILSTVFKDTGISYSILKNQIVLKKNNDVLNFSPVKLQSDIMGGIVPNVFLVNYPPPIERLHLLLKSSAQFQVSGNVVGQDGIPLLGATILEKGTTNGTQTDFNGNFSIVVSSQDAVLTVSYLGYLSQDIEIVDDAEITIILQEDFSDLNEVIVIGYGEVIRSQLASAVNTIDSESFEALPLNNAIAALQGVLPGTVVTRGNGQPGGGGFDLTIRGSSSTNGGNSPLIIIDGIPGNIIDVNAKDIETVTTLKDGAASIYGARAANGVIIVTTKQGERGTPSIELDISNTISRPVGFFTSLSSIQVADFMLESYFELDQAAGTKLAGNPSWWTEDELQRIIAGEKITKRATPGRFLSSDFYDYTDLVFDNGYQQNYNLSISGAGEKNSYRSSISYVKENGVLSVGPDSNTRFNARINDVYRPIEKIKIDTRLSLIREHTSSPINSAFGFVPFTWPFFPDRPFSGNTEVYSSVGGFVNPLATLTEQGSVNRHITNLTANIRVDYNLVKNFTLTTQIGGDYGFNESTNFNREFSLYDAEAGEVYSLRNSPTRGSKRLDKYLYSTVIAYVNYNKRFGKHNISTTIGGSHEERENEFFTTARSDILSTDFFSLNLGDADSATNNGFKTDWSIRSLFGRGSYIYDDKYILTSQFRYDGSSRFSEDTRWGLFWGVSLAWNAHKEKFIEDLNVFDNLKLRLSTGQTGNQEGIGLYDYQQLINIGGQYSFGDGTRTAGAFLGGLVDPTRTWETVQVDNIGIDFTVLNNKLIGAIDYFIKTNKDMLAPVTTPAVLGASAPFSNNALLRNKGFEVQLTWKDQINQDFSYLLSGTLYDSNPVVIDYAGRDTYSQGTVYIREGYSINEIYGYKFDGIIQNQQELDAYVGQVGKNQGIVPADINIGDARYRDINGDGRISAFADDGEDGDLVKIGSTSLRYSYGFNLGLNYKNFELSAFFQGVLQRDFFTSGEIGRPWAVPWRRPDSRFYNTTWTPNRTNAKFPRSIANNGIGNYNFTLSDNTLLDASYLRWKNLRLGYNLPDSISNQVGLRDVKVYLSGFDLWEITNLDGGYDPESANINNYPFSRRYSLGVEIGI